MSVLVELLNSVHLLASKEQQKTLLEVHTGIYNSCVLLNVEQEGDGKFVIEAGDQGVCCGLVAFSIVSILRNAFSPSIVGKEKGEK